MPEFLTLQEMALAARRRLAPEVWDYLSGGSESETTLARNRQALDSLAFRPRVLRDVSAVTLSSSLLGQPLSLPVILAPIGSLALLDSGAALSVAKAAEASGTTSFVSTMSQPKMETVAAAVSIGLTFQLYVRGDEAWIMNMMKRAEGAGFRALCLTVDTANYGRRERDLMNRFSPVSAVDRSNLEGPTGPAAGADQAKLTWDSLARIRKSTALPLILKGVMTAEDAQLAVEHGVNAVYVSNHGGRQLDHSPGTLEQLPEIVKAVAGRAEVLVDGGFVRGSDIVKAIALGANAVGIGKLQGWALAAGGEAALRRALELLGDEMRVTMALLGVKRLDELRPAMLQAAQPAYPPGPLSAFRGFDASNGPAASPLSASGKRPPD